MQFSGGFRIWKQSLAVNLENDNLSVGLTGPLAMGLGMKLQKFMMKFIRHEGSTSTKIQNTEHTVQNTK